MNNDIQLSGPFTTKLSEFSVAPVQLGNFGKSTENIAQLQSGMASDFASLMAHSDELDVPEPHTKILVSSDSQIDDAESTQSDLSSDSSHLDGKRVSKDQTDGTDSEIDQSCAAYPPQNVLEGETPNSITTYEQLFLLTAPQQRTIQMQANGIAPNLEQSLGATKTRALLNAHIPEASSIQAGDVTLKATAFLTAPGHTMTNSDELISQTVAPNAQVGSEGSGQETKLIENSVQQRAISESGGRLVGGLIHEKSSAPAAENTGISQNFHKTNPPIHKTLGVVSAAPQLEEGYVSGETRLPHVGGSRTHTTQGHPVQTLADNLQQITEINSGVSKDGVNKTARNKPFSDSNLLVSASQPPMPATTIESAEIPTIQPETRHAKVHHGGHASLESAGQSANYLAKPMQSVTPEITTINNSRSIETGQNLLLQAETQEILGWEQPRLTTQANFSSGQAKMDFAPHVAKQLIEVLPQAIHRPVEITLSPEELGRVRMSVQSDDGIITVNIIAERADTLDLMRRNIDQLGQSFRSLGYETISFSFGQGVEGGDRQNQDGSDNRETNETGDGTNNYSEQIESDLIQLKHGQPTGIDIRL